MENAIQIKANLKNANIMGANQTNVKGLTVSQVKAAQNWEKAKYDASLAKELGRK